MRVITYDYDGLLRLTSAVEAPGTQYRYNYDSAGNRTDVRTNGVLTQHREYDVTNQVIGWQYDAAGNLYNNGSTVNTYDALNRTTQVNQTGNIVDYHYNGDGTLVSETNSAATTRYTQDLAAPLSQILQSNAGGTTSNYLYGLDRLSSRTGAQAATWYLHDGLGSVRRTVTNAGVPVATNFYDPFGQVESGTVSTFGFTGELQDSVNGSVYLRARWYNPATGTFPAQRWRTDESSDTTPYSHHPYAYALGDPVLLTDPTGKYAVDPGDVNECLAGIAFAIGYANSLNLADNLAPKSYESQTKQNCRHIGNILAGIQSSVEIGTGGTIAGAGSAACVLTAGGACVVSVPVAAGGVALVTHGATVGTCATTTELIGLIKVLLATRNGGGSGAGSNNEARRLELGEDPKRGYIEHEGEVGALIEDQYGGFKRDMSGDGEWISQSGPYKGKSFDSVGLPSGKSIFHSDAMENFLPSIDSHFRKSVDYIVLDTRYMTSTQKATVLNYIDKKWFMQSFRLIMLE